MKRKKIYAANWKMNKTSQEAISFLNDLLPAVNIIDNRAELIIFPPAVYLQELERLNNSPLISLGIQNFYYEIEGAFTGEISAKMVKDLGSQYVMVGHSERRHLFKETNEDIAKKINMALSNGLDIVFCIGETDKQRNNNLTSKIIKEQLEKGLAKVPLESMAKLVIAYEPVWAIGTGKVATPEIAEATHLEIRNFIKDLYDNQVGERIRILYGGSVKPDNVAGLQAKENIDGFLIGGASLKIDSFLDIIKSQG